MIENIEILDRLIIGYVPHKIYAFSTPQVENHLKVGETSRSVAVRLKEWQTKIADLNHENDWLAMLPKSAKEPKDFFQDFALHRYFEDNGFLRLSPSQAPGNSREFFPVALDTIEAGIAEINRDYLSEPPHLYTYLKIEDNSRRIKQWARTEDYKMRKNQKEVISNIIAVKTDPSVERNYLLFAVMRFGKTFVALQAAKELGAGLTVIVSAKADVKNEWKKNLESHTDFEEFVFIDSSDLSDSDTAIDDALKKYKAVLFLTLQDLKGHDIKVRHKQLFDHQIGLLIIDETHFGARAQSYGHKLKLAHDDENDDEVEGLKNMVALNVKYKLHLSGTPYRILMGDEFLNPKQIVGKIRFEDILNEKECWYKENLNQPEWKNPYFGFPQMIRFAFSLSESAKIRIKELTEEGATAQLNEIFSSKSTSKDDDNEYLEFKYKDYVLETIKALDGVDRSDEIFSILDYPKVKSGKMAQHIVMVLPYRASCDAMAKLLSENNSDFINLNDYEVINIASIDRAKTVDEVKKLITEAARVGRKTISLTVNKMLTGVTVPQWDAMIYLKGTQSPQEYDQAIYRLQSPYITTQVDENGNIINKEDLKPQTLLIDFSPSRMMSIEQHKAFILSASDGVLGNDKVQEALERQMNHSPIVTIDNQKLTQVKPADVLKYIAAYSSEKGIIEEAKQISVDLSILKNELIMATIDAESEIGSKSGIKFDNTEKSLDGEVATEDEVQNIDDDIDDELDTDDTSETDTAAETKDEKESLAKKIQNYYLRILFYAFLSKELEINSLSDVIASYNNNERLAKHLGLEKSVLLAIKTELTNPYVHSDLDNKISNANSLLVDDTLEPAEKVARAIHSFDRISDNEVFTPKWVAENMVEYVIDEMDLANYNEHPQAVINLTSKSGMHLLCMWQKLLENGCNEDIVRNNLFAITTSPRAYEFTRKVYELMNWNLENLIEPEVATSFDLIGKEKDVYIESVSEYLKSKHGGTSKMNFDIVLGNPPYQKSGEARDEPVYHRFYDLAEDVSKKYCLISPARFLFNAGQTSKSWNEKMLNNEHLKVEFYSQNSASVFPKTDIKGGIAVLHHDKERIYGSIGMFSPYEELKSIVRRVIEKNEESFMTIVQPQGIYRFSKQFFDDFPQAEKMQGKGTKNKIVSKSFSKMGFAFRSERQDEDVCILGLENSNREYKWISPKYLVLPESFDKYRVIIAETNNTGVLGETLSDPHIGLPFIAHTDTFLTVGAYDTNAEANAVLKYIKTKFARALLGFHKITQHTSRATWEKVPLQDFTVQSDIDWTKPVPEIDKQLYSKYGLNKNEIDFIEEKVAPME